MLNHFVCGTGSFNHQDEDGLACSSPKKSKRSKESRNNKNPYSNRGLDKFSALLADLDERRQKLYSQMSPQDISFVRFAYSSNDDFVPIVVKVKNNKDRKKHKSEELKVTSFSEQFEKSTEELATFEERNKQPAVFEAHQKKNLSFYGNMLLKRPSFYVPAVVVLILVFLVLFGRSVATLCTCVVWYVVPTLREYYDDSSKQTKKSMMNSNKRDYDYVKGWLNDMKMMNPDQDLASPTIGGSRPCSNDKSSGKHAHQKSWQGQQGEAKQPETEKEPQNSDNGETFVKV